MKFIRTTTIVCAALVALAPSRLGGQGAQGVASAQGDARQGGAGNGGGVGGRGGAPAVPEPAGFTRIKVTSSIDQTEQDAIVVVPQTGDASAPRPMVVFLHAWSVDDTQRQPVVEAEAEARGWLLLIPNFRGRFDHPGACGMSLAQQDVLDAITWVKGKYKVDDKRVYAMGLSGGAFMTMLMVGKYPQVWAAGTEYAGIYDLPAWYEEHATDRYADNMKACFGGAPGDSAAMMDAYKAVSPLSYLKPGLGVPLDLHAGKNDPTVAYAHSVRAFQALVPGVLTDADTRDIQKGVPAPPAPLLRFEPLTDRQIYLRREVGNVRLTIYEGVHEWFPKAAFAWVEQFKRP